MNSIHTLALDAQYVKTSKPVRDKSTLKSATCIAGIKRRISAWASGSGRDIHHSEGRSCPHLSLFPIFMSFSEVSSGRTATRQESKLIAQLSLLPISQGRAHASLMLPPLKVEMKEGDLRGGWLGSGRGRIKRRSIFYKRNKTIGMQNKSFSFDMKLSYSHHDPVNNFGNHTSCQIIR